MTKLIRPFTVTPANLTSNVAEDDAAEYSAAATYALGDQVMNTTGVNPTYHVYESLVAGNIGNALTDASKWLDLGPTNRWAMFDQKNGTVTTGAPSIDVTVAVTGRADGVALFGLDAAEVQIIMATGPLGTVYDQTYSLQSESGVTNWYDYFSEEIVFATELVVTDLPLYTDPTVQVIVTKDTGNAVCGTLVLGQTRDIGDAVYGAKGGIQDYSRKEVDDFGNYSVVERSFSKRVTLKLVLENNRVDATHALLSEYRATPAVWVGTPDYSMTWVFGFFRDFSIELATTSQSYVSLEIEGLT